jgi:hypothetical protein
MKYRTEEGEDVEIAVKTGQIQQEEAELIVVNLFEGVKTPGGATRGRVDRGEPLRGSQNTGRCHWGR